MTEGTREFLGLEPLSLQTRNERRVIHPGKERKGVGFGIA
jgi:hypothetical protein